MNVNGNRVYVEGNGYISAECVCGACNDMRHEGAALICDRCGERIAVRLIAILRGERVCPACHGLVDCRHHGRCNVCGADAEALLAAAKELNDAQTDYWESQQP